MDEIKKIILKNQEAVWAVICLGLFLSAFIDYAWLVSLACCLLIKDDQEDIG